MTFQDILKLYGYAMLQAQHLEERLYRHKLRFSKEVESLDVNALSDLDAELRKKPLGRLIDVFKEHWDPKKNKDTLDKCVTTYLGTIKQTRDDLAHHFFRRHLFEQHDSDSIKRQADELVETANNFKDAISVIAALTHRRCDKTDWSKYRQGS
jgi:hypothetical protein